MDSDSYFCPVRRDGEDSHSRLPGYCSDEDYCILIIFYALLTLKNREDDLGEDNDLVNENDELGDENMENIKDRDAGSSACGNGGDTSACIGTENTLGKMLALQVQMVVVP